MAASLHRSALLALLPLLLCGLAGAKEFLVGGDIHAWSIASSSQVLNRWAEANRFQVGDSLVWRYDSKEDSVLQVTRKDYLSCNTSSPIAEHKNGNTTVKLGKSGAYYFISGAEGACEKGEKLIVVVISDRHRYAASPAPSLAVESEGPAVAPTSGAPQLAALGRGLCVGFLSSLVLTGLAL